MSGTVAVFGGTGFLGRRVVRRLRQKGFSVRVATRHPDRGRGLFGSDDTQVESIGADIHEDGSVARAVEGAHGVVNAVSLYVERGKETFHAVHVAAAERLAGQARKAGVERLAQVSGIGADARSWSAYIRARGEGEQAVRRAFAGATVIRPAVMFGPDDAFLNTMLSLMRWLPVYPMFGRGETRLQPAFVDDVAEAIAAVLQRPETSTFEFGGPRVYTYEALLRSIAREANISARLMPMPFGAWHALAWLGERLPRSPITRNQVELMQVDNVASPEAPGFAELGIVPRSVEEVLHEMLRNPHK